jgi:hypothetical protein
METRDGSEAEGLRKVIDEMPESYVKGLLMTRICFDAMRTTEVAEALQRRAEVGDVTLN